MVRRTAVPDRACRATPKPRSDPAIHLREAASSEATEVWHSALLGPLQARRTPQTPKSARSLLVLRTTVVGRPGEDLLPIRERDRPRVHRVRRVLGAKRLDRHLIAGLETVLLPSPPRQRVRIPGLASPVRDVPI